MNYQQYGNRIEVVVKKGGGDAGAEQQPQGAGEKSPEEESGNKTWRTTFFGTENKNKVKRLIRVNATHTLAVARQWANLEINYATTGISYVTGDSAYQDLVQRRIEQFQDSTNVATSIVIGGLYGASAGPLGAVLGATIGGATTGISTIYKYRTRERDYDYKLFKENNSVSYMRARANVNLTTGRLR